MRELEEPANVAGISMEMHEQRLGRVHVQHFDAAEPPPDMSGFEMTTISEGSGIPLWFWAILIFSMGAAFGVWFVGVLLS